MAVPAGAETRYISDVLMVPLRSGPSARHRILHAGLPSGTRLEIVAEDAESGFTQVRTSDGTEGWVPSQYLVAEPIARFRLNAANRELEAVRAELEKLKANLAQTSERRDAATERTEDLAERNQALSAELAEVRRISANAIALDAANDELEARNAALEARIAELTRDVSALERDVRLRWLLFGGGLVLIGIVIGVAFRTRRKRRMWA